MVVPHLMIDAVYTVTGVETTERIEMVILVAAFKNQVFVIDIAQPVRLHERRPVDHNELLQAVVLCHHYPHLVRIPHIQRRGVHVDIHLLIAAVELDIRVGAYARINLHQRLHHTEGHLRHFVIRITVLVDRQQILATHRQPHIFVRKIKPVMRIFAARVDGVLIIHDIAGRETL